MAKTIEELTRLLKLDTGEQIKADDLILARKLEEARVYMQKHYNPMLGPNDSTNPDVLAHVNKLVDIALRHSDDRIAQTNADVMRNVAFVHGIRKPADPVLVRGLVREHD